DNGDGTITVPAGVTGFTVSYPTSNDTILENNETTELTIDGVVGTGTIKDALDAIPVVSIEATTDTAIEGDAQSIFFTVTQTGATDLDSTVTATLNLGDLSADDIESITFTDATGSQTISVAAALAGVSVTIPAGSTVLPTFSILPNDDAIYEVSEDFSMSISNPVNATLGTATDSATVFDEDQAVNTDNPNNPNDVDDAFDGDKPTLTVGNASATEGDNLVHQVT
ncbi:hypothetical protein, partial [Psychrobacter sp. Pi2-52]|uniref:hypothetical protein n=1 Tax=Psychrobacter sp. Pi2-52 TaxID=2774133 RepID=UPI00191A85D0